MMALRILSRSRIRIPSGLVKLSGVLAEFRSLLFFNRPQPYFQRKIENFYSDVIILQHLS